jgi:hypothetical protein
MNQLPEGFDPTALTDLELAAVSTAVVQEQHRRALEAADIEAIVKQAFEDGFAPSTGLPRDPWLHGGLLICPGSRIDKSATSHECGFVSIGERWVWESEDKVHDVVRNLPGPRPVMRSVSIVAPWEGMEVDLVISRMRTGVHTMKNARSFVVTNGKLELVATRAKKADYQGERR